MTMFSRESTMKHCDTFLKLLRLVWNEIELRQVTSGMHVSVEVTEFRCRHQPLKITAIPLF